MCGEPQVAAECTCTEREFGRCSRPTVRPGRTVHDERDHGDGSDTRPCGRRTSGSLTEIRVRDWQYWRERVGGPDHEPMPAGRDRPAGQDRPRRVHRARRTGRRRWRAGPCHRRCAQPGLPAKGGEAARPWDAATGALVRRPRLRRCSWQRLVAHLSHDPDVAWRVLFERAGSDLFTFVQEQLTVEPNAFDAPTLAVDVGVAVAPRTEAVFGVEFGGGTVRSEYRDLVDNDRLPITQATRLRQTNLSASVKLALTPRGGVGARIRSEVARGQTRLDG